MPKTGILIFREIEYTKVWKYCWLFPYSSTFEQKSVLVRQKVFLCSFWRFPMWKILTWKQTLKLNKKITFHVKFYCWCFLLLCLCKLPFFQNHSQFTEVSAGKIDIFHFSLSYLGNLGFPDRFLAMLPKFCMPCVTSRSYIVLVILLRTLI